MRPRDHLNAALSHADSAGDVMEVMRSPRSLFSAHGSPTSFTGGVPTLSAVRHSPLSLGRDRWHVVSVSPEGRDLARLRGRDSVDSGDREWGQSGADDLVSSGSRRVR